MADIAYRRILLKLSGEALAGAGKSGIDFDYVLKIGSYIKECVEKGVQIAIVVGGGNYWRGRSNQQMDRTRADYIGMLATTMNALTVQDALIQNGVECRVMSAIEMRQIAEPFIRNRAISHLEKGYVVIFASGTGNPYFSTDTCAALRAAEINADVIFKATNVDGVYTADPKKDPNAKKLHHIRYMDILKNQLGVMDSAAAALCNDNNIPIYVFDMSEPGNIVRAVMGEDIGTTIDNKGE